MNLSSLSTLSPPASIAQSVASDTATANATLGAVGGASAAGSATAARDAAIPEAGTTSSLVNALSSIAQLLQTPANSASGSVPCPTVPQSAPPTQQQQAQSQTPLTEDLGLGDDSDASTPASILG